jgi:hypothetical protein
VREVEREFLAAMQANIRLLTFADHRENARMLANESSPNHRVADLFDRSFFAPITGTATNLLRDLPIQLDPAVEIASERTVVPRLILNATSLNSGHLFQLSGSHVGETSVFSVSSTFSAMQALPRLNMDDPTLSRKQRGSLDRITLGEAVMASCCVPGIVDPFELAGLYGEDGEGEEVVVRLVDGGVFDNQGLVSLFEEDCTHFVCSDGSDVLQWQANPAELFHNVALRANDILMDRVRITVMQELMQRGEDSFALFTLGAPDGGEIFAEDAARFARSLKCIRTDLDAFSDIEAWSLMYHGFMVSRRHLIGRKNPADSNGNQADDSQYQWRFNGICALAADPDERERILKYLEVGSRQFLKVFYLGKPLPWFIVILPSLIPVSAAVLLVFMLPPIPAPAWIVLGLMALSAVAFTQNARIIAWLDQVEFLRSARKKMAQALEPLGITIILGGVGALASWINLRIFNPLFLRYGRLEDKN